METAALPALHAKPDTTCPAEHAQPSTHLSPTAPMEQCLVRMSSLAAIAVPDTTLTQAITAFKSPPRPTIVPEELSPTESSPAMLVSLGTISTQPQYASRFLQAVPIAQLDR